MSCSFARFPSTLVHYFSTWAGVLLLGLVFLCCFVYFMYLCVMFGVHNTETIRAVLVLFSRAAAAGAAPGAKFDVYIFALSWNMKPVMTFV